MTIETLKVVITAENKKLNDSLKNTKKQLSETSKQASKSSSNMQQEFGKLAQKFSVAAIAVGLVLKAVQKLGQAIKQGISNAYQYSKAMGGDLARSMDEAKTSMTYATNALGAAFIPLLKSLLPIIVKVSDVIATVANKIAEVSAAFRGDKTFMAAKKASDTWAESTVKDVDKVKKATAGFDELNIISSESKSESKGAQVTEMFEEKEVGSNVANIANSIKEKLAPIFEWLKERIETVKGHIQKVIEKVEPIIQKVLPPLKKIWETIKTIVGGVFDWWTETYDDIFEKIINSETVKQLEEHIPTVLNIISSVLSVIWTILESLFSVLNSIWTVLQPLFDAIDLIIADALARFDEWWQQDGDAITSDINQIIQDITADINYFIELFKPVVEEVGALLKDLWDNFVGPLFSKALSLIKPLIEMIKVLWENVLSPLVRWLMDVLVGRIKNVIDAVWTAFGPVVEGIINGISIAIDAVKGIIEFLTGVFTGDWERAWDGIKQYFGSIWETMKNTLKTIVNFMIGIINGFLKIIVWPINKVIDFINSISFDIPDWVPLVGGKHFGLSLKLLDVPQIPLLAQGGIIDKATIAMLGESGKEAVVPLENNTDWIDMLAEKLSAGTPSRITLNVDGKQLGYAVINNINNITKQTGSLQLSLV